jgi:amino acid transporter
MRVSLLKRWLLGAPKPTAAAPHERLSRAIALPVFSSDALSSVAYATEEILLVLVTASVAATHLAMPVALAIAGLLAVVTTSYQQTIRAYPTGGGSYIVSRTNLGPTAGLVAGAALLIDYVLTVAVSVAAGIAALTSAVATLGPYRVPLGVACVAVMAVANLRGVRESGRLFAVPTYLFLATFGVLITTGLVRLAQGGASVGGNGPALGDAPLTWFLILRAFASGCTALTGIEAISNGVPAFREPEARNAAVTMRWMAAILAAFFLGVTLLARAMDVMPVASETVVSQLARGLFGASPMYYLVQGSTTLILILAANTAFADFPRLASLLARDGYAPRQLASRGDRLVFSNGIGALAVLAMLLLVLYGGDTHALIPLYAVGVFLAFTLSQAGMARHWLAERGAWWRGRLLINGTGGVITAVVALVIAVTKFTHGAWMVIVLIPLLVVGCRAVQAHYRGVGRALSLDRADRLDAPLRTAVLVPVADVHRGVVKALRFAQAISVGARALYIEIDPARTPRFQERWTRLGLHVPLVILHSPYRSVLGPLLEYIEQLQRDDPDRMIAIVLPEFVPRRWWQHLLHNQTALLIKGALLFRRGVVVIDVPFHLPA